MKTRKLFLSLLVGLSMVSISHALTDREVLFQQAARNGEFEIMKACLAGEVDINCQDKWGDSALMHASAWGQEEEALFLISQKANLNLTSHRGGTALTMAVSKKHTKIAVALIRAGADVLVANDAGQTALSLAKDTKQVKLAKYIEKAVIRQLSAGEKDKP